MNSNVTDKTGRDWREALAVYSRPRVIAMCFLGFSAGLPFLLVFSTLSAWLRDAGLALSTIGFFSWIGITYSIKVFWAPVVDRTPIFVLTRRWAKTFLDVVGTIPDRPGPGRHGAVRSPVTVAVDCDVCIAGRVRVRDPGYHHRCLPHRGRGPVAAGRDGGELCIRLPRGPARCRPRAFYIAAAQSWQQPTSPWPA